MTRVRSYQVLRLFLVVFGLSWALLASATKAGAQTANPQSSTPDAPQSPDTAAAEPPRFVDVLTVSATLTPSTVKDTPGTVSVIGAEAIVRNLIESVADLVKFEPGIYIESNLTRIGLNGFNIRGIGGNRVMTQVDGVETSEQFDFGPFNVHQLSLDLDTLKTAEIVRSAGSSLYGSDALGGVVSFFTKDPADYLRNGHSFDFGAKTLFDGRSGDASGNAVVAGGRPRTQASLFVSYASGHEPRNQGTVETEDARRTILNSQDRQSVQALGKFVSTPAGGHTLRAAGEVAQLDVATQAYSLRGATVQGPITTNVADVMSDDTMRRSRISLDHAMTNRGGLDQWSWNAYAQNSDTQQIVDEVRIMSGVGPATTINRSGTLDYDQRSFGGSLQGRKAVSEGDHAVLVTFGGGYKHNTFDMMRDRVDVNAATGAIVPPTNLILPSKYYPRSDVGETGAYIQAEMRLGKLTLIPGVRHDRFSLDADGSDVVYIASLSPSAADFSAGATSAKIAGAFRASSSVTIHAQYAGGFRAPPYSAVNSGFTNLLGGYTSIPNTDLDAETSDNMEFGVRSTTGPVSMSVTGFWNTYDNFIQQVQRGINPTTGLLEFQYQNVSKVKIRGIELQGEARLMAHLRLRGSYAIIRGDDVSSSEDVPLSTIAPDQGVIGLQYTSPSSRWGSDLTIRAAAGQSQERAGEGMFAPEAFGVVDLLGWFALRQNITLRAGVLNVTDAKYFEWSNVRGRPATDPVIDRYSSPGTSAVVSLSYGW